MTARKALIVGATGLVGSYCLQTLLDDPVYSEVIAPVRRPLAKTHPKQKELLTSFRNLEQVLAQLYCQDVFCCLGTTLKTAGSQKAFRDIDCSLVVTIAEIMKRQGADQFVVISAMGADKDAKIFYNRTKGEMEELLRQVGYSCLRIIRPSLLLGPRQEFRLGEKISVMLSPFWKVLLLGPLAKYRPVEAEAVARFMVKVAQEMPSSGIHVYESDKIA